MLFVAVARARLVGPSQVRAIATPEIGRRPRDALRLQTQDLLSKIKNFDTYQLILKNW